MCATGSRTSRERSWPWRPYWRSRGSSAGGAPQPAAYNLRVMAYENLLVERDGAALIVTINRPSKLNALNGQTLTELGLVLDAAASDDGVRALVLTGAGEKAFVAGADIERSEEHT